MNKEIGHVPDGAIERLQRHDWPGNIRELQNIVERAVIMSAGPNLDIPFGELTRTAKAGIVHGGAPYRRAPYTR